MLLLMRHVITAHRIKRQQAGIEYHIAYRRHASHVVTPYFFYYLPRHAAMLMMRYIAAAFSRYAICCPFRQLDVTLLLLAMLSSHVLFRHACRCHCRPPPPFRAGSRLLSAFFADVASICCHLLPR